MVAEGRLGWRIAAATFWAASAAGAGALSALDKVTDCYRSATGPWCSPDFPLDWAWLLWLIVATGALATTAGRFGRAKGLDPLLAATVGSVGLAVLLVEAIGSPAAIATVTVALLVAALAAAAAFVGPASPDLGTRLALALLGLAMFAMTARVFDSSPGGISDPVVLALPYVLAAGAGIAGTVGAFVGAPKGEALFWRWPQSTPKLP